MATEITIKISLSGEDGNVTVGKVEAVTPAGVAEAVPPPPPYDESVAFSVSDVPAPPELAAPAGMGIGEIPPPPYDGAAAFSVSNVPAPPELEMPAGMETNEVPPPPDEAPTKGRASK